MADIYRFDGASASSLFHTWALDKYGDDVFPCSRADYAALLVEFADDPEGETVPGAWIVWMIETHC